MNSNSNSFNVFNTNQSVGLTTQEFLDSNSLVAKVSFLLLVMFLFIVLLRSTMSLMFWLFTKNSNPRLINGTVDAKQMLVFTQDPSSNASVTIPRSVNENDGIEFSYSVWIYIEDLQYLQGQYRHIFSKGNNDLQSNGQVFPNNAPGLYIAPNTNSLIVTMNTYNVINQEIEIPNIPLNKWINVILRCENTKLDVYINGTITKSEKLLGVPKQNYGNIFVALNGGFSGLISNLWYYSYALGTTEIQRLVKRGPNTKMQGNNINMKNADYLSLRWYFFGSGDQFNP